MSVPCSESEDFELSVHWTEPSIVRFKKSIWLPTQYYWKWSIPRGLVFCSVNLGYYNGFAALVMSSLPNIQFNLKIDSSTQKIDLYFGALHSDAIFGSPLFCADHGWNLIVQICHTSRVLLTASGGCFNWRISSKASAESGNNKHH